MEASQKHVETLLEKAAKEHSALGAMQFAQAAANAANAIGQLTLLNRGR